MKHSGSFRAFTYLWLFGLGVTVPLLVFSGVLLFRSANAQRSQIETRMFQAVDGLVNDLDRDLDRDLTILRTLATSSALADADWPTFYTQAKAGLQGRAYLVVTDANGRQLVNTATPYGQQPPMTGDPDTVARIVQTKLPQVSNLFMSLALKKPVFNVDIPILKDGEVRYVLALALLPDDLRMLLASHQPGSGWATTIWDAKGVVLAHSQDDGRSVGGPVPDAMRTHTQRTLIRTTRPDGTDVMHATGVSQVSGWGIGVNIPYASFVEQERHSLLLWASAAVFALTIALALGVFFALQITTPLSEATKAAAAFGRGEPFSLTGARLKEAEAFLTTLGEARETRERLTDEVRQSRDWLKTILASIGEGVIATNQKGRITFLNGVAQELTSWREEEAIGRPLEEVFVICDEAGAAVENPVVRALREGRVIGPANHTTLTAKGGREIPIDETAASILDADGNVTGAVLVFRDVTQKKEADDLLNRNMGDLRRANDDLSQFVFAASHDLQEPLRMITSYSQLLQKRYGGQLDSEAESFISFITDGTKRMRQLLEDLLAYTQLSGREESHESVDLNEAFEAAVENCRVAIHESCANVITDLLPCVPGHKPHFIQLFQNLISNALKYRSERTPQIHVSAEMNDGVWRVAVKDNGIGIKSEYQEQIFGVFKRLHGRTIPGNGIGLAICKRVVERYGGTIGVESQPDAGATFYFTLSAGSKDGDD